MKNRTKLLRRVKKEGKVKGICLDVFEIFCESNGMTGGEVFMKYKKKNPRTKRSRNEIAKRISDLSGMGAIKAKGTAHCPLTGKNVTRWFLTGDEPVRKKTVRKTTAATDVFTDGTSAIYPPAETTSGYVAPVDDPVANAATQANLATLRALARRCKVVMAFRWCLLPGYKKRTQEVLTALEWAIEKGQG